MTIARVCEQWNIKLPAPDPNDKWFLDWLLQDPNQVSLHLTAGYWAWSALSLTYTVDGASSAREYFGGVGAQAMMVENLFDVDSHVVLDYSAGAVKHLTQLVDLNPITLREMEPVQGDSYDPKNTEPADLVGLDFGDLTVWKTRPGEQHRALLDRVFMLEPAGVVLTDIAGPHLHLHRERYETLLGPGSCATYPLYLDAFAHYIQETWGYSLVAGFWHRWSAVWAMVPTGTTPRGVFRPTPTKPVGLELI